MFDFGQDFAHCLEFYVKITPGYHTVQSQSSRGILLRRVNLPGLSYPGESFVKICVEISLGYDTPASQSPRGIILRRVNLPGVLYPGKSMQKALN